MSITDRVLEGASAEFRAALETHFGRRLERINPKPESEIERGMLLAMTAFDMLCHVFEFEEGLSEDSLHAKMINVRRLRVAVRCQAPVLNYRADFLLEVRLDGELIGQIVVECDGHDFHERTKEQAARDRSRDRVMTREGYRVLRFTGSEIYRDAAKCVEDIWETIVALGVASLK